jgi:hypothetical protein
MITITKVGSLVKIDGFDGKDNIYESITDFKGSRMSPDKTQLSFEIAEIKIPLTPLGSFTINGVVPTDEATVKTALATVFPSAAPATALPTETVATYSAMQTSITADPSTKRDFFVSADETNGGVYTEYSYNGTEARELPYKAESISPFKSLKADLESGLSTSIALLGDSTANATDEWYYLFIQKLMAAYPTHDARYYLWNGTSYDAPTYIKGSATGRYFTPATTGSGYGLTVKNATVTAITGDIDMRIFVRATDYTPAAEQNLIAKFGNGGARSVRIFLTADGRIGVQWTEDGTTLKGFNSNVMGLTDNTDVWLRCTIDVDNGASGHRVDFYTSTDGINWTSVSGNTGTGVTSIFNSTTDWELGVRGATTGGFTGRIYHAEVRSGIGGEIVTPFSLDSWIRQGEGTFTGNPLITIFNGSDSGKDVVYLSDTTRLKTMLPIDAYSTVLLSTSHNDGYSVGAYLFTLWDTFLTNIRARVKTGEIVLTTQNPRISPATWITDHAKRRGQLMAWAKKNSVNVVDAFKAFLRVGVSSTYVNSTDGVHPTSAGSQLWANTMFKAFNS